MIELHRVIEAWQAAEREGTPLVLATVVSVGGSTYRRPGARLLCSEERWLAGGISGGCLEGDVLKKAFWRTSLHAPVGLDVGAEGPEEIALSIVSEIQAALAGRAGGPLRDRAGPLHEPAAGRGVAR